MVQRIWTKRRGIQERILSIGIMLLSSVGMVCAAGGNAPWAKLTFDGQKIKNGRFGHANTNQVRNHAVNSLRYVLCNPASYLDEGFGKVVSAFQAKCKGSRGGITGADKLFLEVLQNVSGNKYADLAQYLSGKEIPNTVAELTRLLNECLLVSSNDTHLNDDARSVTVSSKQVLSDSQCSVADVPSSPLAVTNNVASGATETLTTTGSDPKREFVRNIVIGAAGAILIVDVLVNKKNCVIAKVGRLVGRSSQAAWRWVTGTGKPAPASDQLTPEEYAELAGALLPSENDSAEQTTTQSDEKNN